MSTYESCPAKWKYGYIDNLPYKASAAMARGSRLHSDCENYLKGNLMVLPYELKKVAMRLEGLKVKGAKSEETWLLGRDWDTKGGEPWIKAIIDVHYIESNVLHVCDFKSGREYPDHRDQLELYAIMGLCVFPELKRAEYEALYLDTGHVSNEGAILRGDLLESKRLGWNNRAIKIFEDREFKPNPGGACRWCDYSGAKGGPCLVGV